MPTPGENLAAVLGALEGESDYVRFCGVLTAYAESDFRSKAKQLMQNGVDWTYGVYQQSSRYWPDTAGLGAAEQCRAFVREFKAAYKLHTGDPVHDCWLIQRWRVPGSRWPDPGPSFESEKVRERSETWNYARRVPDVDGIIARRTLPG